MSASWKMLEGDTRDRLADLEAESVQTVVTSPPYWGLRDYGVDGQLGLEATLDEYVANLVAVFREVRRVLRDDGTVWLNLGDSYAGLKPKDLCGTPWRVAFALQADGWWLRQEIIWHKPNPMPESVKDRCTRGHEQVFMLTQKARYFYDADAIREADAGTDHARTVLEGQPSLEPSNGLLPTHSGLRKAEGRKGAGRNKRSVWTVATQPYSEAHFATFPPKLIEPCILAGSREGDTVLDPFAGSGTTLMVALRHNRSALGIELNPEYVRLAERRIRGDIA